MRLPFVKNSDEGPARAAQAALKALPRTTARNMLFIVFNIVFAILFRDAFGIMFSQTEAELYSHIVLIPFVSAYFLYSERRVIFSTPGSGACSGLFFLAAGLSLFIFGKVLAPWLGANDRFSLMMLSAFVFWAGGFLLFYGAQVLRKAGPAHNGIQERAEDNGTYASGALCR